MTDASELIERLCVAAGMIIEDTAEIALLVSTSTTTAQRLAMLEQAGKDVVALASAAQIIARRYGCTKE